MPCSSPLRRAEPADAVACCVQSDLPLGHQRWNASSTSSGRTWTRSNGARSEVVAQYTSTEPAGPSTVMIRTRGTRDRPRAAGTRSSGADATIGSSAGTVAADAGVPSAVTWKALSAASCASSAQPPIRYAATAPTRSVAPTGRARRVLCSTARPLRQFIIVSPPVLDPPRHGGDPRVQQSSACWPR
jgi:hypothetical protein